MLFLSCTDKSSIIFVSTSAVSCQQPKLKSKNMLFDHNPYKTTNFLSKKVIKPLKKIVAPD